MTDPITLSRDRLADAILSTALDCIIVSDVSGRIIEFNPSAEQTFGWARADILGRLMEDTIVPHHHRHAHHHGMARYLAEGKARVLGRRVEVEGLRADGHVFQVELSITETTMDEARFFVATLRDITAQREAEASLLQARASLQAIFDSVPAALYLRDRQDNLVMINAWGARFLGRDPAEMIGQPMSRFREPQNVDRVRAADERVVMTGKPETHEFTYHLPGGDRVGLMTFFPVSDGKGEVSQIGGMLIDVTELHHARVEVQEARGRLQAFFDQVPAAVNMNRVGPSGILDQVIEFANGAMAEPYGITAPDLIGLRPHVDFASSWQRDMGRCIDTRVWATKAPVSKEFLNQDTGRHESHTRFPILNASGEITHIGSMSVNIDDRVRAQQELDEARLLMETVFDNIPAELYLRELDGSFIMMNKWGAEFYHSDKEGMKGRLASEFDTGDDIEIARQAQERLLATGLPVVQEYRYNVMGKDVVVSNTMFPVRDAEGRIARIGGFTTDVSELYSARTALQQAQENLHQSEKLAALGQLLAGIAHELNNPLAVVLGRAAILQEKLVGTAHELPLQKLRDAADRCARIVKTFLAMARQTGPRRQRVETNHLIEAALEMTTYGLRTSGITWHAATLEQSHEIEVDQDQIVQVLINLILNAQHALEEVADPRRIEVAAELSGDARWLEIAVADNGPGVPDSIAGRIFDPFFTTKGVGKGTGLGLSVCRSMVEAHGGRLTLEKTAGRGATFRVTLPASRGPVSDLEDDTGAPAAFALQGRILVVDDDAEIAAILADCLSPLGLDCVIATDGRAALARVAEGGFDAVFCDVSMPGMDGIAFYHHLRQMNPILANHLVFISGDVLHRNWNRDRATIDRPIIEKPFDPQQVRDVAMLLLVPEGGPQ